MPELDGLVQMQAQLDLQTMSMIKTFMPFFASFGGDVAANMALDFQALSDNYIQLVGTDPGMTLFS